MPFPTNQRVTTHSYEKNLAQRRYQESNNNDLLNYAKQTTLQTEYNKEDVRVAQKRRGNEKAQIAAEQMFENNIRSAERAKTRMQRENEQNEAIASELERQRIERERQERELQRIVEESPELRELEARLKVAYMNKERSVQQEEKAKIIVTEKQREKAMEDQMEYERQLSLQQMAQQEYLRRLQHVEGKMQLQHQIMDRQKLEEEARKAAEKDRNQIEEILRKIQEDDLREMELKRNKAHETRYLIRSYQVQREREVEEKRQREKQEEDRILEFARQKAAREAAAAQQKAEKKAAEDERYRHVEEEIKKKMQEEEEFAKLRDELWEEEQEHRLREQEKEKAEKRSMMKEEMKEANEYQKQLKAQMTEQQRIEEERYRELLYKKYAEDEKVELDKEVERKQQLEEYKTGIRYQQEQKAKIYHDAVEAELELRRKQEAEEEFKKKVIEEAKQRLLAQHAESLRGYLPRGVVGATSAPPVNAQPTNSRQIRRPPPF